MTQPNQTEQVANQEIDAERVIRHLLSRISELELQMAIMRSADGPVQEG